MCRSLWLGNKLRERERLNYQIQGGSPGFEMSFLSIFLSLFFPFLYKEIRSLSRLFGTCQLDNQEYPISVIRWCCLRWSNFVTTSALILNICHWNNFSIKFLHICTFFLHRRKPFQCHIRKKHDPGSIPCSKLTFPQSLNLHPSFSAINIRLLRSHPAAETLFVIVTLSRKSLFQTRPQADFHFSLFLSS